MRGRDLEKSRIRETPNILTDVDSSTNIFISAGVKKGADRIFLLPKFHPPPDTWTDFATTRPNRPSGRIR